MRPTARVFLLVMALLALLMGGSAQAQRISDVRGTKHNLSAAADGAATRSGGTVPSRTVKATSESQVCVFCHTPHGATTQDLDSVSLKAPLWNRRVPAGSTYTAYTSSSLDAQYITDGLISQPGGSSKLCLSCHDGTLALGSVNVLNGSTNPTIALSGAGAGGVMPSGSGTTTGFTRFLGTDLGNDHPISVTYDSALVSRDGELRAFTSGQTITDASGPVIGLRAPGVKPLMPLEPTGSKAGATGQVQCATCHDPHIRGTNASQGNQKFLRTNRFQEGTPAATFSRANDIICLTCHDKNGSTGAWAFSAHAQPNVADETYKTAGTPSPSALREFPDALPVWKAACLNCHDTHTVQGSRRLLREGTDGTLTGGARGGGSPALENTCYQCHTTTASSVVTAVTGTVPNIATEFASSRRMPITNSPEAHDIGGNFDNTGFVNCTSANNKCGADMIEQRGNLGEGAISNRHAECTDCHNPHRVIRNPNGLPGALSTANTQGSGAAHTHTDSAMLHTNAISGALRGAWGVEPTYGSASFQDLPSGYTVKRGDPGDNTDTSAANTYVTREYQICMKCHSDYGYTDDNVYPSGTNRPSLGGTGLTSSPRTGFTRYTNQAKEFQAPTGHTAGPTTTSDSGSSSSYQSNNYRSWHPVTAATGRTTSVRGGLSSSNWNQPFRNVGTQTMYCSDCHGQNVTSTTSVIPNSGIPWGPHGSSNDFILKGTWDTSSGASQSTTICFKCHSSSVYAPTDGGGTRTGFWIASGRGSGKDGHYVHSARDKISGGSKCNWCHVAVPHGWKNKMLLVNLNDVGPEAGLTAGTQVSIPYTNGPYYRGARLKVDQFRASGDWTLSGCGEPGTSEDTARSWMQNTCGGN